jgi:hypothetical protein
MGSNYPRVTPIPGLRYNHFVESGEQLLRRPLTLQDPTQKPFRTQGAHRVIVFVELSNTTRADKKTIMGTGLSNKKEGPSF